MPRNADNPTAVFDRFGLKLKRRAFSFGPARPVTLPPGSELAHALHELGGIYSAFARFLMWRADLLGDEYLEGLRQLKSAVAPISQDRLLEILRIDLPSAAAELSAELEPQPVWSTLSRTAWRSRYRSVPIIIQIARPPVSESEFTAFERGIRFLGHADFAGITKPHVLREFQEWLRQCEYTDSERAYLDVLNSQGTLTEYPRPIAELSTDRILCWPWVEGEPAASLIERGSVDTVTRMATAVFEGMFSFGIVDAEFDPDAMVLISQDDPAADRDPARQLLAIRRINRPVSVPPALVNPAMKYVAAVLVGDAALTVENLVILAAGLSSRALESRLLSLLSALDPELKVHLWYPQSAAAFESNWRALARMNLSRPLFLDCFHRNLAAIGHCNATAAAARGRYIDAIEEAHWPAVERVLRTQLARFRDSDVVNEWVAGSSLLLAGSMRQLNRAMEEVREDNLPDTFDASATRANSRQLNRSVRLAAAAGSLLLLFFACLRWGGNAPRSLEIFLKILAPFALAGLFWMVSKIG